MTHRTSQAIAQLAAEIRKLQQDKNFTEAMLMLAHFLKEREMQHALLHIIAIESQTGADIHMHLDGFYKRMLQNLLVEAQHQFPHKDYKTIAGAF